MKYRNLSKWSLWAPLLLTLLGSTQLSAKTEDTVKETFSTTGAGLLTLQLQSSSVEIDTYNGQEVSIEIHRSMKRGDQNDFAKELEKFDLTFEQNGNQIQCTLNYENNNSVWSLFSGYKHRLGLRTVVRIPKEYDVQTQTSGGSVSLSNLVGNATLKTSGGKISMESVQGNITARTSGGGIRADDCVGNVDMHTSGGPIQANNVNGTLVARTSGGNITVQDVSGNATVSTSGGSITLGTIDGNLEAGTSGGSIRATIVGQPTKDCVLKTSGGSIHVAIDPKVNLQIDASTSGGGVSSELSLSQSETKRSSMKGRLNDGGPTLKARTSGGSIHINSI